MKNVHISFDEELLATVDRFAASSQLSRSAVVREALKSWIRGKQVEAFEDEWIRKLKWCAGIQRHGSPGNQTRINQPRAHHPSKIGRPGDYRVRLDVVVQKRVGGTLDRGGVRPRYSLGFAGRTRAEQNIGVISRPPSDRFCFVAIAQEIFPTNIILS